MNSNKSLRIILGGALLMLAGGALHRWLANPGDPAEAVTLAEAEAPALATSPPMAALPQPTVQFRPALRPPSLPASVQSSPPPQQKLFVEWKGTWYPAEILATSTNGTHIHYSGYGPEWDEWVTAERMRYSSADTAPPAREDSMPETPSDAPPAETVRTTPEPGDPVVLWRNHWWRAEVLQSDGTHSLIRYVGYGAEWDEWVGADRFKVYSEEDARDNALTEALPETTTPPEPEINAVLLVQGNLAKGDLLVEWGQHWWPGEILQQESNRYYIHYKGYGSHWDEWVTRERLGVYSGDE